MITFGFRVTHDKRLVASLNVDPGNNVINNQNVRTFGGGAKKWFVYVFLSSFHDMTRVWLWS